MVYAIIIAGGKGRRLWPQSTAKSPKYLLPITSDKPMLEETIQRIESFIPRDKIFIVTNQNTKEQILNIIPNLKDENVLGEPFGKNSAPAIAWASAIIEKIDSEAITLVLPADHYIPDKNTYLNDVKKAVQFADKNPYLVTFGIIPTRPDIGYGYVELAKQLSEDVFAVACFTEKPDIETAKKFLSAGNYRWNSGMFVWKIKTIMKAFQQYQPKMYELIDTLSNKIDTDEYENAIQTYYKNIPNISIDYAIMEKAEKIATISAKFAWDDVGSWQFLTRISQPDSTGNYVKGRHLGLDTKNCIIYNELDSIVGTVSIEDLIIVNTSNGVLVCKYSKAGDVNKFVKQLEKLDV